MGSWSQQPQRRGICRIQHEHVHQLRRAALGKMVSGRRELIQRKIKVCATQSSSFSKLFSVFYYFRVVLKKVIKLLSKIAKLIVSNIPVSTFFTLDRA